MRRSKDRLVTIVVEGVGAWLELAVRAGLVGGSAVAALFGQFVLAAVLAVVAAGMFLRLWRGKINK